MLPFSPMSRASLFLALGYALDHDRTLAWVHKRRHPSPGNAEVLGMALQTANVTVTPISPPHPHLDKHILLCFWKTCVQAKFGWVADGSLFEFFVLCSHKPQLLLPGSLRTPLRIHVRKGSAMPSSPGWSHSTLGTVPDPMVPY